MDYSPITNSIPLPETPEVNDPQRSYLKIYILPNWILEAFASKYNLVEIHKYGKLRSVASLIDLAELEVLRNSVFPKAMVNHLDDVSFEYSIASLVYEHLHSSDAENQLTEKQKNEIMATVNLLKDQPETIANLTQRLIKSETFGNEVCLAGDNFWALTHAKPAQEKDLYRVISCQDKLYIIVEEGFLSQVKDQVKLKAFLTTVLKSAYAIAPVSIVNRSLWYRQYLNVLADEA